MCVCVHFSENVIFFVMNQVFKHTHYLLRPCKKSDLLLFQRLFLLLLGIWSFGTINTVSVSLDAKIWMLNGPSLQSMQSQLSNSNLTHKSLASHLLFIQSILSQRGAFQILYLLHFLVFFLGLFLMLHKIDV